MRRRSLVFRVAICILTLVAVSCSSDPAAALVGIWHEDSTGQTVQFFHGGTISIKGRLGAISGTYSVLDATHLKLELGGIGALAGPVVATYEISSSVLKVTTPDGRLSTYKRVD